MPEIEHRPSCIYCRVNSGDEAAVSLYAGPTVVAFLDLAPINAGHVVVAPRTHVGALSGLDAHTRAALWEVANEVAVCQMRILRCEGYTLFHANGASGGQTVEHACVHIVPRHPTDGFHWNWRHLSPEAQLAGDSLAAMRALLAKRGQLDAGE